MKKLLMLESTTFGDLLDVSGVRERAESRMIQRFLAQASVFRKCLISSYKIEKWRGGEGEYVCTHVCVCLGIMQVAIGNTTGYTVPT